MGVFFPFFFILLKKEGWKKSKKNTVLLEILISTFSSMIK